MYNVYMKEYTIVEFRQKLREAFQAAHDGADVAVHRFGETFWLVKDKEKVAPTTEVLKKAIGGGVARGVDFCPHGFGKGMCKSEDCNKKYR